MFRLVLPTPVCCKVSLSFYWHSIPPFCTVLLYSFGLKRVLFPLWNTHDFNPMKYVLGLLLMLDVILLTHTRLYSLPCNNEHYPQTKNVSLLFTFIDMLCLCTVRWPVVSQITKYRAGAYSCGEKFTYTCKDVYHSSLQFHWFLIFSVIKWVEHKIFCSFVKFGLVLNLL